MTKSMSREFERLTEQEGAVEAERERSRRRVEAARRAYEKAMERDERVQANADANMERIEDKRKDLTDLFGGKKWAPKDVVKQTMSTVVLTKVQDSEDEADDEEDVEKPQKSSSATTRTSKKGRAAKKPMRPQKTTGMFEPPEITAEKKRRREAKAEKMRPKSPTTSSESSEPDVNFRIRQRTRESTGSEIEVDHSRLNKTKNQTKQAKWPEPTPKASQKSEVTAAQGEVEGNRLPDDPWMFEDHDGGLDEDTEAPFPDFQQDHQPDDGHFWGSDAGNEEQMSEPDFGFGDEAGNTQQEAPPRWSFDNIHSPDEPHAPKGVPDDGEDEIQVARQEATLNPTLIDSFRRARSSSTSTSSSGSGLFVKERRPRFRDVHDVQDADEQNDSPMPDQEVDDLFHEPLDFDYSAYAVQDEMKSAEPAQLPIELHQEVDGLFGAPLEPESEANVVEEKIPSPEPPYQNADDLFDERPKYEPQSSATGDKPMPTTPEPTQGFGDVFLGSPYYVGMIHAQENYEPPAAPSQDPAEDTEDDTPLAAVSSWSFDRVKQVEGKPPAHKVARASRSGEALAPREPTLTPPARSKKSGKRTRQTRSSSSSSGLFVSERSPTAAPRARRQKVKKDDSKGAKAGGANKNVGFDISAAIAMGALAKYSS